MDLNYQFLFYKKIVKKINKSLFIFFFFFPLSFLISDHHDHHSCENWSAVQPSDASPHYCGLESEESDAPHS